MQKKEKKKKESKKQQKKETTPKQKSPSLAYAGLEIKMFPHHPWEREGLCLDTIQHRVTSSSPLQQIPKVPDLNPALTCRQCMEAVGSSRGHQVSERRGRP